MIRRILVGLALLLAVDLAHGQAQTTGKIAGRVVDELGNGIAGAQVSLQSAALQGVRSFETDARGRYTAALLPPGSYRISVTASGKRPATYEVIVGIGQTIPLESVLGLEGVTETMNVTGDLSKLTTTTGGENFNYERQVDELPIVARDFERVAELAPNISFGPSTNTLSISGAPSFDTVVLVDGAEVSDPYFGSAPPLFLEDALEEVQVMTSGISARYGRFQGGVINATTKSGSNLVDAGLRVNFAKQSWNQRTPYGEDLNSDLQKTYLATVGGPIVQDHLWYFIGGRTIPSSTVNNFTAVTAEPYPTTTEEDRWQIKLTGAFSADHVIEGSFADYSRTISGNAGLPAAGLLSLADREDPRQTTTLEYQGILSDRLFLTVQATRKRVSSNFGATDASRSPFFDLYGGNNFQIWHNHWWDFNDTSVRDNDTLSASLTQVLSTGNWGDHSLEYGAQFVRSTTGGENRQSVSGYNLLNYDAVVGGSPFSNLDDPDYDPLDPRFNLISYLDGGVTYRWYALPLGGDQQLDNLGLYVQDSWEKGPWRVEAGLRWETYDGKGPEPTLDLDFTELSPRLGVTYNMANNWQLQASWGKYVSRFNDNVASSISGVGGAPYVVALYTGPTSSDLTYDDVEALLRDDDNWNDLLVTITDPTQPTRFLAKDATAPYAYDFTIGIERALPRSTGTVTLSYSDRSYRGLLDDFIGDQGISAVVDPISGDPLDFDTTIWTNASSARRDYDALTATVDYRPNERWGLGGNWTYAHTQGNYEGEGENMPSSGSVIGDYVRSIPQAEAIPYGYLDEDIRHRIRSWGTYRWDLGRSGNMVLGAIGTYQSGRNFSRTASLTLSPDLGYLNEVGQTYSRFFDGRGNDKFNGFWRLDLSSRYQFGIWKKLDVWVKLDILNLTNNDELLRYSTGGTSELNSANVRVWAPTGIPAEINPNTGVADPTYDPMNQVHLDGPSRFDCLDSPSRNCTGFGRIRNANDYQAARSYNVALGLSW